MLKNQVTVELAQARHSVDVQNQCRWQSASDSSIRRKWSEGEDKTDPNTCTFSHACTVPGALRAKSSPGVSENIFSVWCYNDRVPRELLLVEMESASGWTHLCKGWIPCQTALALHSQRVPDSCKLICFATSTRLLLWLDSLHLMCNLQLSLLGGMFPVSLLR